MAILAAVASIILVGGWWVRPREVPHAPPPVPTETELEQLERRAERRSLDRTNQFFADVAGEVAPSIAYLPSAGASGIAWDASRVVTAFHPRAWSAGPVTLAGAREILAEPTISGPNLPLAVLTMTHDTGGLSPARRSQLMPATGDWLVAVWRTGTASAHGVGNFLQVSPITCGDVPAQALVSSLSLTETMTGGGLFDLDGGLLAIVLPCQNRLVAITTSSMEPTVERAASPEQQLVARYGLGVGMMSPDEREYFKVSEGVLVRRVWIDYSAGAAGFRPGDVITAVNGQAAATVADLTALIAAKDISTVTALRGRSRLSIPLATPADAPASVESSGAGLLLEEAAPTAYRIASVRPGSRAARAGIEPGDLVVRVDLEAPRGIGQIERALEDAQRPVWLELARDGRRYGVLLR